MENIIRVPGDKLIEELSNLKKSLIKQGLQDDANNLTVYTMAESIDDATAAYPTITEENEIAFVLVKECPVDDCRMIVTGQRRDKMVKLFEGLKTIHQGGDADLEQLVKEFEQ